MVLDLIDELFSEVPKEGRCPYIRKDETSAYCSAGLKQDEVVSFYRRYVCDSISLQLWCLDKERCDKCIYHNGERFSS